METYSLLRTVPVFADLGRRARSCYHSLKHVNRVLRLGLQLGELFLQLMLLLSWPVILLCYVPIIITDRILHGLLAVLIRRCPAIMGPPSDVYETVTGFVFSLTIGRVVVFFLLLSAYFVFFVFEFFRAALNFILFFVSPLTYEEAEPLQALRFSPPPSHTHSIRNPHGHAYSPLTPSPEPSPSPPPSPPRTVVLPGAQQGPVRVVEAVATE